MGIGAQLHPRERSRLEECLGEDFASIRVVDLPHIAASPEAPARVLGTCMSEEIYVRPELPAPLRMAVLAHELSHAVQRRNATRSGSRLACAGQLEAEANGAALACVLGQRFTCRLSDAGRVPRYWGVAGHYYTALFVMLTAGMDAKLAARQAMFTQMPDQVDELDATCAGLDLLKTFAVTPFVMDRIAKDYAVQKGLHCLTGGNAALETARRQIILQSAALESMEFGLAIHPFGDSYAHRVLYHQDVLYGPGAGHLRAWTTPDFISTRPALYVQYGLALFKIIADKLPASTPRRVELADLDATLRNLASLAGDQSVIFNLDLSIKRTGAPASGYRPEQEPRATWKTFAGKHGLGPQNLADALRLAAQSAVPGATYLVS